MKILFIIKGSLSAGNQRVNQAFKKVTAIMFFSIISFLVLALVVGLETIILPGDNIAISMIPCWIQEVAGYFAVGSILLSLMMHQPNSTKKSTQTSTNATKSGEMDITQPNSNLEKARLELQLDTSGEGV